MWPFSKSIEIVEKEQAQSDIADKIRSGFFSTDTELTAGRSRQSVINYVNKRAFPVTGSDFVAADGTAMDSAGELGSKFAVSGGDVPDSVLMWYASQSYIGAQLCGLMAQHWLVDKACTMPAKDAIRNGYDILTDNGVELSPEVLSYIKRLDKKRCINNELLQFVRQGRIFGIRIAIFKIDGIDYSAPFNPDGVTAGSYRGITQVDPYWISPELNTLSVSDPASMNFYEPEYWNIQGQKYHKSHLVIFRTDEVVDVLKPSYQYAGVPIPQRIFERVYAAERTANEAPQLTMTKRLTVLGVDLSQAVASGSDFINRLKDWAFYRDNYGIKIKGGEETIEQFDTSLAELDAVIMTQYQLVAAAASVPATKLLGTSPKGFNASGEYEEASYHEELESLQAHDMTPFLDRHYLCLMRSSVNAKYPETKGADIDIAWRPLDAITTKEQAEVNLIKAQSGQALVMAGAIDGTDERDRLIKDPDSGYTGMLADPDLDEPVDGQALPVVTDAPAVINESLRDMSGKQAINFARILRKFEQGQYTRAVASTMLGQGFGLGESDIAALLDVADGEEGNETAA